MPRQKRADEGGLIYHALNRGNARQTIFHKNGDYEAFLRVLRTRKGDGGNPVRHDFESYGLAVGG